MKLIVVRRTAAHIFERLSSEFADDPNVKVVWERRTRDRRVKSASQGPERRARDRRLFAKPWNHLGYFVIHTAESEPKIKLPLRQQSKAPASRTRR